ncbi:MAG: glycosyltransferase [Candidatus Eisenbacteria bacterium]|nr:glycosyltransferase [Candidatus Eisenbacteria bacterium]
MYDTRVSVVIPTYGKRRMLEQTLRSLESQTYPAGLTEVVIVDDCSADDTPQFLSSLKAPFTLRTVRHDVNRGRSAARNTAVNDATGDLVVFIDDDMRCEPDLLEEHVKCHKAHPDSVVIGSALTAPEFGHSTAFSYLDGMGVHRLPPDSRSPARYFVTNNASVARQALIDVGLFDEDFTVYGCEDTEIAFRLEDQAGLGFRYCSTAVAYHIHHQTLDQVLSKRSETACSLLQLLAKHPHRASELSLDVLMPPRPGDGPGLRIRKLAVAAATNTLFRGAVRALARRVWLRRLSVPVMVYLIACQYRRGLARAVCR